MKTLQFSIGKEKAIKLYKNNWWIFCRNPRVIAEMGLRTAELCLPFDILQEKTEKALGRPVWTHEFASLENLLSEFYGDKEWKSYEEVYQDIPGAAEIIEG